MAGKEGQLGQGQGFNPDALRNLGNLSRRDLIVRQIPVDQYIQRYEITDQQTLETLRAFPTLCYLLGRVTDKPQTRDSRPDGIERDIWYLTEESGMFGLKNPEDAMRWKGIFNHTIGTARQVYYLSQRLADITDEQRQQFAELGFDMSSFKGLDPELLRDFMFISHAGRRAVDEKKWHELKKDKVHLKGDSGVVTLKLLKARKADPIFIDLMRVETHAHHLVEAGEGGFLRRADDNLLTYCDWTFGQVPNTLKGRYTELRASKRQPEEILDVLEKCGTYFEDSLKKVLGENIYEEMAAAGPYEWETQIRKAYCSSSGLELKDVFPNYSAAA